ncbi:molybdenum cofactor guanylyltransferase [Marinobacterium nitratireducens]|uniref:Molybdenum cofactor guanylyltransferase n=1 Tax=Marinobacterium nitratireducens TaxID=518897 RepID=A0A918DUQ1_9GAMM|nr:molybdenum cofactor guanylyltransferase [Marinobacterium nitratireducens]GGO82769.1 molybdenum cofactor guanylyltransferase [Marinobacterium nitratireducens]
MKLDALILAGGESRRMGGGEKGLLPLAGRPMICHLIDRLRDRVERVWIGCRGDQEGYRGLADGMVEDQGESAGPLSGIGRALETLDCTHLLVMPCDTPLVSGASLDRMIALAKAHPDRILVVQDGEYLQTLHLIVPVSSAASLVRYRQSGRRAVRGWLEAFGYVECRCDDPGEFLNINTPQALVEVEARLLRKEA